MARAIVVADEAPKAQIIDLFEALKVSLARESAQEQEQPRRPKKVPSSTDAANDSEEA